MKQLEAEIWCPQCHQYYGRVFRDGWANVCEPEPIPTYCPICEIPTERKR